MAIRLCASAKQAHTAARVGSPLSDITTEPHTTTLVYENRNKLYTTLYFVHYENHMP